MNEITLIQQSLTITSLDIAERTGKQHKNVLTDIRKMFSELDLRSADFSADLPDSYGRLQPGFILPRREALILATGYSTTLRAKLIDRLTELEGRLAQEAHTDLYMTHQTFRELEYRAMERSDTWCVEMHKCHLDPHMREWFAKEHPEEGQKFVDGFMAELKKFVSTFLPDGDGGLRHFPKSRRKGRASVFIDSAMSLEEGVHSYWMKYKHAGANKPTLEEHLLKVCYCPREGIRPPEVQHLLDMQDCRSSIPTLEGVQQ